MWPNQTETSERQFHWRLTINIFLIARGKFTRQTYGTRSDVAGKTEWGEAGPGLYNTLIFGFLQNNNTTKPFFWTDDDESRRERKKETILFDMVSFYFIRDVIKKLGVLDQFFVACPDHTPKPSSFDYFLPFSSSFWFLDVININFNASHIR